MKNKRKYTSPLPFHRLPNHLKNDKVHAWRAITGIELIHQEPTLEELHRIWQNWKLMPKKMKEISDNQSVKWFNMDNATHYQKLIESYVKHIKNNPS